MIDLSILVPTTFIEPEVDVVPVFAETVYVASLILKYLSATGSEPDGV